MTPTEHQRRFYEHHRSKPLVGLDRWANHWLGRWKRGPWASRELTDIAARAHAQREELKKLPEDKLDAALKDFLTQRRRSPERTDLVAGLALLAVAAQREMKLAAYEVQLMSAAALVQGYFSEVDTGEGKTLAIALAAAYLAASGPPLHVITANDYLASRDAQVMKRFYTRVGLTVGAVTGEHADDERRMAYAQSITYTTAKECAADYLRDKLQPGGVRSAAQRVTRLLAKEELSSHAVQRGLHFALVDEADHALVDEAVTPLIISRTLPEGEIEKAARAAWSLVQRMVPVEHYTVDLQRRFVEVLRPGLTLILDELALPEVGLWGSRRRRVELVRLAVEAREFFRRDEQYVVDDGKIIIVDPATGRPMPMRTWRQGLHQIIEAKEGLSITGETETLARISFQTFFRKYKHLAGASGTLKEAADELWQTYAVPFVKIPRHLPSQLRVTAPRFYPDEASAEAALLHEVKTRHARGQPVLIGTRSVDASEHSSALLSRAGMYGGRVLNAIRHREEALLVTDAGARAQLTIATSMAGRGTDIRLEQGVDMLGGLHVISIEANDSARVDRQLFGRAGRQGDPGSVMSLYHVEDTVLRRFLPERLLRLWARALRLPLTHGLAQVTGRWLLRWCHYRAGIIAARSRNNVMHGEQELERSLAFTERR
jgi:preprotein translocase subunit SecA